MKNAGNDHHSDFVVYIYIYIYISSICMPRDFLTFLHVTKDF